MHILLIAI